MGLDIRKGHFLKTNSFVNPGPGSYENRTFGDKNKAPQYGFGTSSRETDYIKRAKAKIHSTPGPGSYKIPVHVSMTRSFALSNKDPKYTYV